MANYDGIAWTRVESFKRIGMLVNSEVVRHINRAIITTDKPQTGSHSMLIMAGGQHQFFIGLDAGSQTVTVYVWPPTNGVCVLEIIDPDSKETKGIDINEGTGAWEQLSITFTAEQKVYIGCLRNNTPAKEVDSRAYFDNIAIS